MTILIVTGIFPPDIGGPATYVPLIAGALASRGHQVKVLTTSEPEDLGYDDRQYPFPVVRLNRRLPLWRRTFTLIRLIIQHGREADLIYANGMYLETALANKLLRKPLVVKIVGDEAWERATRKGWTRDGFEEFQSKRQPWPAELNKWQRAWAIGQADRVIVPSRYLKRIVTQWGIPEERCAVVYNAVQTENSENTTCPENGPAIFQGKLRLVTVGRLIPLRNLPLILQAIARLPETTLTVIGDGPCFTEWLNQTEKLGLKNRVRFLGSQPSTAVRKLLRHHDIFVLASSHEGFPHSVLEAMEAELAVVATAVGGTPEVVEDGQNGLLVPPNDEEALYQALARLTNDTKLRNRLAQKGRKTVEAKFTTETMINKTEAVLEKAVKPFISKDTDK
ncbi:glycosyltransferase family 4 protein [Thermodesulfitimonas autotrophica]|uniref:glycosyltransferase family 4 protein n=1 Tax=Thermodesulfitimonas autotrophica TaxID=1894989 RepID=UPI002FE31CFA